MITKAASSYRNRFYSSAGRFGLAGFFLCTGYFAGYAQVCPANIDFESGTFNGWNCYVGSTAAVDNENVITLFPSGAVPNRHTMFKANTGAGVDLFGGFPINCPNGSGYSIKLGNDRPGTEAEGVSYEFTIPATRNEYSLIYHYAVVFQDPNHLPFQQPRFEVEITNVSDNSIITCSSFTFFASGSLLPGFFLSPNPPDDTPVWCKDWSAVSINLDGLAGKTIRLFFKTADCTFRRHFGYAYIDVNSECSSEFTGAAYCPDDTAVNVIAPYGYQNYTWYNNTFSNVLGKEQVLRLNPPPPPGTSIAVEVVPYNGYGCIDTLYARLIDTLKVVANAGADIFTCNGSSAGIGSNARPGLVYRWSPASGLSNPAIANPSASPAITTSYVLSVSSSGGGCLTTDTVVVSTVFIDTTLQLIGSAAYCEGSGDSTLLLVQRSDSIQWYRNGVALTGANQQDYRVTKTGTYHASFFTEEGCSKSSKKQDILIERARSGINYPVQYAVVNLPQRLQARQFGSSALWSPAIKLDNAESYTPVFNGQTDQLYTIKITTAAGCLTVDTQVVKTVKQIEIYVPSGFTPNNDGKNDMLFPILIGVKELRYFRIYNRWGQLIYESVSDKPGWNGRLKGILQLSQVYVWIAEAVGVDGSVQRRKGTTVLIR